jgi:glycosyltransferase involved in cell wall biosynthesis
MPQKPKILIVSDVPGWAYDNVSSAVMEELQQDFRFIKIFAEDLPVIDHHAYDLVYCMYWRSDFLQRNLIPREKLCLQVASFWSWQEKYQITLDQLVTEYLNKACAVSVNCPMLYDLISPRHPRVYLNPSGVDTEMFHPHPPKSTKNEDVLTVGWTGSTSAHGDNKGLLDIIQPACQSLDKAQLRIVTKEEDWLPHHEMPNFYRDIDVYVCASQSEGTPNPVLEAAASARTVISTPVGIVPMLIKNGKNGFLVRRNRTYFEAALLRLRDDRKRCISMGIINRQVIEDDGWSWKYRSLNYKRMFTQILG